MSQRQMIVNMVQQIPGHRDEPYLLIMAMFLLNVRGYLNAADFCMKIKQSRETKT